MTASATILPPKNILLIISGSISAYKSLEVIRELKKQGHKVQTILTQGGAEFITPLSVAALSENPVYTELFSLKDETEMGHIRLSREAEVIAVIPASANMIASMTAGRADCLASAVLLATNPAATPVFLAPAMNPLMWHHPATKRNMAQLKADGVRVIEPNSGLMACGETGQGRLPDTQQLIDAILAPFRSAKLAGKHIIITGGGTQEAIDPVRYIGNHSSGKQAVAIADACAAEGANVTFIHGAMNTDLPKNVRCIKALSATQMQAAVDAALPANIAICAAAVADWQAMHSPQHKLKKTPHEDTLTLTFKKTPDILQHIAKHPTLRPDVVVGFAAETEHVLDYATEKRTRKGCDWILANDVSAGAVFGKEDTHLYFISQNENVDLGLCSKKQAAKHLTDRIIAYYTH
jgi:phosphopantothenoylcysteine decarboxylase / phosphopantothenate---cysteine ligase